MINVVLDRREFYAYIKKGDFNCLPNLHLKVPPLVDFHLHDLDKEGNFELTIKQKSWYGFGVSKPKINLHSRDSHVCLTWKLPERVLYKNINEVLDDFKNITFDFRSTTINFAPISIDEESILNNINRRRYLELKEKLRTNNNLETITKNDKIAYKNVSSGY